MLPSDPIESGNFGSAMAGGDVDGDALSDLVVSAPSTPQEGSLSSGSAYVFFGGLGVAALTTSATLRNIVPRNGARFGQSVAVADLDLDGRSEIVVGVQNLTAPGRFDVWHGNRERVFEALATSGRSPDSENTQDLAYDGTDMDAAFGTGLAR